MTTLSDLNQYYRTTNATAIATDIATGKTAYVASGKVTGTHGTNHGILLDYVAPQGTTGDHDITEDELLILSSDCTLTSQTGKGYIHTDGYIKQRGTSTGYVALECITAPVIGSRGRRFEVSGRCLSPMTTNADGFYIGFNHVDFANRWIVYFQWETTGQWNIYFAQIVAGAWSPKGSGAAFATTDTPMYFNFALTVFGDTVQVGASMFETDTTADAQTVGTYYYVASRTDANVGAFGLYFSDDVDRLMEIKSFRVTDL